MSISTATANSFKQELFAMNVHAPGDTYKILLIKVGATGTYDGTLTNVGTPGSGAPSSSNVGTDEVTGTGYTSGGTTLTGFSPTLQGTTGCLDFATATWASSTISAIGAVIYNSSKSNKVLGTFSFGGTITDTAGTFTATMPTVGASTSLFRNA